MTQTTAHPFTRSPLSQTRFSLHDDDDNEKKGKMDKRESKEQEKKRGRTKIGRIGKPFKLRQPAVESIPWSDFQ